MNFRRAKEMIDTARQKCVPDGRNVVPVFPTTNKVPEVLQAGTIGELKFLEADFGFSAPVNLSNRVYNLALGGGFNWMSGFIPVPALLIMGKPSAVKSFRNWHQPVQMLPRAS